MSFSRPSTAALRPRSHAAWTATGILVTLGVLPGCHSMPHTPVPVSVPKQAIAIPLEPAPVAPSGEPPTRPAQTPSAPAVAPAPDSQLTPLLAEVERVLRLPAADLAAEINRLGARETSAAEAPLLQAVALMQTRQAVDTARALGLVQRVLENPHPDSRSLHPIALLIESRLLLQRRLEEQIDRQTQQLRDAQRRNEQLSERLEAVRAIERSLTARPAPPPPPARVPRTAP